MTVIDPRTGEIAGEDTADAFGHYEIEVPSGEYLVHLEGIPGLHVAQFHDGSLRADHAFPLSLAPGDDRSVTPTLARDRAWIGGEITAHDPSTGYVGLEAIDVDVIDIHTGVVVAATTTAGLSGQPGLFETEVPSGDFVLRFTDPNGDYRTEFYPAGVSLRDVQDFARREAPRTTRRDDRARAPAESARHLRRHPVPGWWY